jgi:exosome complex RNA-binding protein Rrp42 (RNase PH superfamily)
MHSLFRQFLRTAADPETLLARDVHSLSQTGENLVDRASLAAVTALVIAKQVMVRGGVLETLYPSMS